MTMGDAVIAGALGWQKANQERDEWKSRAEKAEAELAA